ncbi:MAG: phospholipid-binding lipoprotein MlaA [Candidatus Azotimanducaceae bacterium]|jgi:phospholipid-binding lipoprotein MlaA
MNKRVVMMKVSLKQMVLILGLCGLPLFSLAETDPLETVNRKVHGFNQVLDRHLLRPVARGYDRVLPLPAKKGVNNFFGNLGDISDGVNNLLQGKMGSGISDLGRVLINSTIGIGGIFDPATGMGLEDHSEDFGQTLAVWGVPRGPYVVLPGMGPSSLRNVFTRAVDSRLNPLRYYYPVSDRNILRGLDLVNTRARLLAVEGVVFGDEYLFFRDAYLQRRAFLEKDGRVEDSFDDDF